MASSLTGTTSLLVGVALIGATFVPAVVRVTAPPSAQPLAQQLYPLAYGRSGYDTHMGGTTALYNEELAMGAQGHRLWITSDHHPDATFNSDMNATNMPAVGSTIPAGGHYIAAIAPWGNPVGSPNGGVCPNSSTTNAYCNLDDGTAQEAISLTNAEAAVANDVNLTKNDPNVIGYWILDDFVGRLKNSLAAIKRTIVANGSLKPTICGMGDGTFTQRTALTNAYSTASSSLANWTVAAANYNPLGCDILILYPYTWPNENTLSTDYNDFDLTTELPFMLNAIKTNGVAVAPAWDPNSLVWGALGPGFSLNPNTGQNVAFDEGQLDPPAMVRNSEAYCQNGAAFMMWYTYDDGVTGVGTNSRNGSSYLPIQNGAIDGANACRDDYWSATPTYHAMVKDDLPATYWRLNDSSGTSAVDTMGADNGAYSGTPLPTLNAPGLLHTEPGTSAQFNGTTQYVDVPTSAALAMTTGLTIDTWIESTAPITKTWVGLVSKPNSYFLELQNSRPTLTIYTGASGGTQKVCEAPLASAIVQGQPYHLVATYDGGHSADSAVSTTANERLYENGVLVQTCAVTGGGQIVTSGNDLFLGAFSNTGAAPTDITNENFAGRIADVAVYPAWLSDRQVAQQYQFGAVATGGGRLVPTTPASYSAAVLSNQPISYWRLGEASGTTGTDQLGIGPLTYVNAPTLGVASLLGTDAANTSVTFNGTTQYGRVAVPSGATGAYSLLKTVSLEAWVKPSSLPAAGSVIFGKTSIYRLELNGTSGNIPAMTVDSTGSTDHICNATSATLSVGVKAHLVGTYDGQVIRIYVNGALANQCVQTAAMQTANSNIIIGAYDTTSSFFAGTIDDAAVYPRALTPQQVLADFTAGN